MAKSTMKLKREPKSVLKFPDLEQSFPRVRGSLAYSERDAGSVVDGWCRARRHLGNGRNRHQQRDFQRNINARAGQNASAIADHIPCLLASSVDGL